MNNNEETARFTIRDESEAPVAELVTDAKNLRMEKLSTRITLVAVLIPCLLVIVLAVAYLDIKKRVTTTQTTGSMDVQNLSKELEDRFAQLTESQVKLEKQVAEIKKALDKSTVAWQSSVKKSRTDWNRAVKKKADTAAFTALTQKTDTTLTAVTKEVAQVNAALEKFDDELAGQIERLAQGVVDDQKRLEAVEAKAGQLETEKLSKASMELSLRMERLALQEMVKDKVRELEGRVAAMEKKLRSAKRPSKPAKPASKPPASSSSSKPSSSKAPLEEQPIE